MLHKRKHNREDCIDSVIGTAITRLLRQNNDWKDYRVDTFMERERVIKEISDQINQYALPFFERFPNIEQLVEDVEKEGFLPHRKKFESYYHISEIWILWNAFTSPRSEQTEIVIGTHWDNDGCSIRENCHQ